MLPHELVHQWFIGPPKIRPWLHKGNGDLRSNLSSRRCRVRGEDVPSMPLAVIIKARTCLTFLTRNHAMTAPVAVVNFMNYEGWE